MTGAPLALTVVIATKDRHHDLRRCLSAIASGTARPSEVIVVDDGSSRPISASDLPIEATVLRLEGVGPGGARNAGALAAGQPVVLFTDDDTVPDPGWALAASGFLEEHPDAVGVEGPVETPPFDPLFEFSIEADQPGHYWTCNVAYRRETFEQIGGFAAAQFPYAHCEDRDLGLRAAAIGQVGYSRQMRIVHTPRQASLRQTIRRGRFAASELTLAARHPGRAMPSSRLPPRVRPPLGIARRWVELATAHPLVVLGSPRRLAFFVAAAVGQTAMAVLSVATYHGPLEPRSR